MLISSTGTINSQQSWGTRKARVDYDLGENLRGYNELCVDMGQDPDGSGGPLRRATASVALGA